ISLAIISVPAPAPRRKPTIRNRGRVPSVLSTQYPTKTPISVVTRSETPISEKRMRYPQPWPGSIMGDLIRPRQYSRGRCAQPPVGRLSQEGQGVEVDAAPAERSDLDRVRPERAEVPVVDQLLVAGRALAQVVGRGRTPGG